MALQWVEDLTEVSIRFHPFSNIGVDYAFNGLRLAKDRGQKAHKAYCILFICLSTRVIDLEVADYTTDGFLAVFERLTERTGLPVLIDSDNEMNFRGIDKGVVQENSRDNERF